MATMTTRLEKINRKKAEEYLESNVQFGSSTASRTNRPLNWNILSNYAVEMLKGNWKKTHQGIAFDENGNLVDGQHRLWAIIMATDPNANVNGIPSDPSLSVEMLVTRGADPDIFEAVDIGRNRTAGQILAMAGVSNSALAAAACRLLYLFDNVPELGNWRRVAVSRHDIRLIAENTKILSWINEAYSLKYVGIIGSATLAGTFICERAAPEADMESFIRSLRDGVELSSSDPVFVLRKYMIGAKGVSTGPRRDSIRHLFMFIKTWNNHLTNTPRHVIQWKESEGIIRPIGWKKETN